MFASIIITFMCFNVNIESNHEPPSTIELRVMQHTTPVPPETSIELQSQDDVAVCTEDNKIVVILNPSP